MWYLVLPFKYYVLQEKVLSTAGKSTKYCRSVPSTQY